jgi:hypothetical protein
LKLKYDDLLSSFAFEFNLRRYTAELQDMGFKVVAYPLSLLAAAVGPCYFKPGP